jgi:hypothetical protein
MRAPHALKRSRPGWKWAGPWQRQPTRPAAIWRARSPPSFRRCHRAERIGLEGEDIEARRRAIRERLKVWPVEIKARAGVIVTVNREGDLATIRGLLRDADRKALEASQRKARKGAAKQADRDEAVADQTPPKTRAAPEVSESLTRRLAGPRCRPC